MKTINIVYNNSTDFILEIVNKFKDKAYIEIYNADIYKERRKVRVLQEDYGTKNFPFLVFEDENLKGINAIYSESNPDWEEKINEILEQ